MAFTSERDRETAIRKSIIFKTVMVISKSSNKLNCIVNVLALCKPLSAFLTPLMGFVRRMKQLLKQIYTKCKLIQGTCNSVKWASHWSKHSEYRVTERYYSENCWWDLPVKSKSTRDIHIGKRDDRNKIKTWTDSIKQEIENWEHEIADVLKMWK